MAEPTIDPAEVRKFSDLAAQWWDPKGPFGALHRLNPVRLRYIREISASHFGTRGPKPLCGLNLLDLGCGGGLVSIPLARMGAEVCGIEASHEAIGAARAYATQAGLDVAFEVATAEALAECGRRFDLVVALEIVEHAADAGAFLAAAEALVEPGGALIVSTINRTPKARALAIFGAEQILKWAPAGAHDYEKLVTPDEIRAGAHALIWRDPVGVTYNPLGTGWSLSANTDMNYMMVGMRPA